MIITVRWRKRDDEPEQWHVADFSDERDAHWFADRLTGHGAVEEDSITVNTKINKVY